MNLHDIPTLNACLNLTACVCLLFGWRAIKRNDAQRHKKFMLAALGASFLFLISYLYYHYSVPGVTKYQGEGVWRTVYFAILLTHTPLATLIVPFILAAVYFALKKDFARHIKITRWLFPVWIYVSITGVLIYLMLYVF